MKQAKQIRLTKGVLGLLVLCLIAGGLLQTGCQKQPVKITEKKAQVQQNETPSDAKVLSDPTAVEASIKMDEAGSDKEKDSEKKMESEEPHIEAVKSEDAEAATMEETAVEEIVVEGDQTTYVNRTIETSLADWIKEQKEPVFVDFWAPWCIPCRMAAQAVEKIAQDYAGKIRVIKVNVDLADPVLTEGFDVMGIPAFYLMNGNDHRQNWVGYMEENLQPVRDAIDELLKK